jgi:hypothetical protein
MVIFSQTKPPIELGQIQQFEKRLALKLPEEYKNHLLKYNGGRCEPSVFSFEERGIVTTSLLDRFLALYDGKYDNIETYANTYKIETKRLPYYMVPIAHDPGGNLICISCGGNDNGCIYFWDHEREVDYEISPDSDHGNLYLIAKSFNLFLENLKK